MREAKEGDLQPVEVANRGPQNPSHHRQNVLRVTYSLHTRTSALENIQIKTRHTTGLRAGELTHVLGSLELRSTRICKMLPVSANEDAARGEGTL